MGLHRHGPLLCRGHAAGSSGARGTGQLYHRLEGARAPSGLTAADGILAAMTQEHAAAAVERLARLSELRADLQIAHSTLDAHGSALQQAGRRVTDPSEVIKYPWPSVEEYRHAYSRVTDLKREIDTVINELGNLGVDHNLFVRPE